MARYDVLRHWFQSPGGRSVLMCIRESTNDWNTAQSCLTEDEYGLRGKVLVGRGLDLGGHIGGASVAALVDNPGLRLTIVEPLPENLELIRANLTLNGVADRATVIDGVIGCSGESVTVNYQYEGEENELHHAFIGNTSVAVQTLPHRTVTYKASGIRDLLGDDESVWTKLDTEGGEYAFLADPNIAQLPYIVGEWHPTPGHVRTDIDELLGSTHDLTYTGPEGGPGGFTAVRRVPHG